MDVLLYVVDELCASVTDIHCADLGCSIDDGRTMRFPERCDNVAKQQAGYMRVLVNWHGFVSPDACWRLTLKLSCRASSGAIPKD